MQREETEIRVYALGISSICDDVNAVYQAAKELQERRRILDLLLPIDHLATRVYSQNRKVAILEWLPLSSYYYWGSYDIAKQDVAKLTHAAGVEVKLLEMQAASRGVATVH